MKRALTIAPIVLSAAALAVALLWRPAASAPTRRPRVERPEPSDPAPGPPARSLADDETAELSWRITGLSRRLDALEKRVSSGGATTGGAGASAASAPELADLRSDIDALLTGQAMETQTGRARVKEIFRSVQDEVFAERAQERMTQREQAQAERFKAFVTTARLSAAQEQQLKAAMDAEQQRRTELMEKLRAAGPGQGGRQGFEEMRALRQSTDEAAKKILSEEQYSSYEELRQQGRGRGPGGPGGGFGGGAAGAGGGGPTGGGGGGRRQP
ncbi:MAG: hypothetical protein IT370_14850 [Deltaproteobacteria bacterium]|nr:hypothetical protein [Deltaproteobacteria bacterium]